MFELLVLKIHVGACLVGWLVGWCMWRLIVELYMLCANVCAYVGLMYRWDIKGKGLVNGSKGIITYECGKMRSVEDRMLPISSSR